MANTNHEQQEDINGASHSEGVNEKSQQDAVPNGEPKAPQKQNNTDGQEQKQNGPAGGFDKTPIPSPPQGTVGYTLKITILQATNLAMGDAHVFSSDPYVLAQMNTDHPIRHKQDPKLRFRTPTVRKSTEPEWNEEWIVANVPSTGFELKLRVYDEDPADHDDMLGKVHVTVPRIDDDWTGLKAQPYKLTLRHSSRRALLIRAVATCFRFVEHMHGDLYLAIENLGRTQDDSQNGRLYTAGPCRWFRHYSPLLGRIANIKEPDRGDQGQNTNCPVQRNIEQYNFQANQMQLPGPVPPQLYHRFVEFKPWVARMFTTSGFQGVVLGKALHHQHTRVYNFGRSTLWGHFPEGACVEMTEQFLDLVHFDKGGRIFTYVLTLDALWRFTETGKEFGIDMLSKHTMHSDVSIYIAFSGEFFIRRLKQKRRPPPPQPAEESSLENPDNETHPPYDLEGGPPDDDPPKDPSYYELVIDNDSGTYRPNAAMLPVLAAYLSQSLPGLHIQTLDCQADAEKMAIMKNEQRERKQREGDNIIFTQGSDSSSISSSDDERLDEIQSAYQQGQVPEGHVDAGDRSSRAHDTVQTVKRDMSKRREERMEKVRRNIGRRERVESELGAANASVSYGG